MHLRAIHIRGFKSFVDPIEIRLDPGVAVVVGPNGSGKSNVADAIVWAAGSLSPSELRAEKPDDVLFAGSGTRKPADFCEVELLFDNADGAGPVDFAELAVARRLHRGGEGQYLVNRVGVRRLDLVELLADLGLGGQMHSIIGQGKVEEILGSTPEKRREFVEEAAGLGRFKRRRHRAELKLARVTTQVERARDVEGEVRKRLRPLALQATAAERAERIAGELAGVRARIARIDLDAAEARLVASEERRTAAALARTHAEQRLESVLEEREAAEEELADAAGRREAATAALYRLTGARERLAVRREQGEAILAGASLDLEAARAGDDAELAAARTRSLEAARGRDRLAAELRTVYASLARGERADVARLQAALDGSLARRSEVEEALAAATSARDGAREALYRARAAAERAGLRREAAAAAADEARRRLAEAEEASNARGPSPAERKRAADEAAAAARAAAFARDDLAARARLAREQLAALERSVAEREGLPPAARALAEEGHRLALSQLDVPAGRERAVAAALGWRASALVARDAAAGLRLLEKAHALGLGSLSVLLGDRAQRLVADARVVPREELLASDVLAVTTDGIGYDPAAGELWFAGEAAETVLLELDARRRALAEEADALDGRAAEAAAKADAAAAAAERAETAFAAVAHLLGVRRGDPAVLRRLAADAGRLEAALADLPDLVPGLSAAADEAAARAAGIGDDLRAIADEEARLRREADEAAGRAAAAERELARLGGGVEAAGPETDRSALAARATSLAAELERAEAAAAAAADRVHALRPAHGGDPETLARIAGAAERLLAALAEGAEAAGRLEPPLRARVDAGGIRTQELAAELRRLGAAEAELRRESAEAAERAAAIDVERARIEAEAGEARRRLDEAGAEPSEGDDRDALAEKADRLARRLEALGRVNPFAKEEYAAEKERLEELATQRADLEASLRELETLRNELTETVETRFAETFAAVAAHFEEVAGTLFPGGEGRLRLTEPDDEEGAPGIEVELRPAGKRITRLSLLSGGEKALGAISFLFALFLARPCPFYLLDEVEAALDDTNIGRFVELLRRYSDRAQFVVITHQKRTMEAADVLYGVTMGGDGVSQVVSRRLPQEDRAALASA